MMTLGKLLHETTLVEAKPKWKKLGDQYTLEDKDGNVIGMFMKQAKGHNDQKASYEVQAMDGIDFKKFGKIADAKNYITSHIGTNLKEAKYRDGSVLADLQVAWNKYRFNQDQGNAKQAVKFKKSALKLWGVAKRMDSEARNASGKLWKDVIDSDVSDDSGRKPKIVKMSETSLSTFSKELLGEAKYKVTVYDAGESEMDRYTVILDYGTEKEFYGMSEDPNSSMGYNQWIGTEADGYEEGKHLGKKLSKVPKELVKAIKQRGSE